MLFHSPTFLIFFTLFLTGLALVRGSGRVLYVTVASYIFYAWWYPPYVVVLAGLTVFAHVLAHRRLESTPLFVAAMLAGLLPLAVFKYTGFILANLGAIGYPVAAPPKWALPLGISFISFTAIAYIADCRSGRVTAEKGLLTTALFFSFFPHLIAGPVVRAHEIMHQMTSVRFDRAAFRLGLLLFAIGAVKKVGVADQIAPLVESIYHATGPITWAQAVLAFYGFAVQIYCDFSGYTDMALALAIVIGVTLPPNFDRPYLATSLREFWRRWHMTLSRWLRDYLYVPLGGSRHGSTRMVAVILITMLLGGLWHGAAWTFVAWGLYHGLLLVIEHLAVRLAGRPIVVPRPVAVVLTFHLVAVGWVLFRAPSFGRAMEILSGLGAPVDFGALSGYAFVLTLMAAVFGLHRFDTIATIKTVAERLPAAVVVPLSVMLALICAALVADNPSAFIYFDF
ncbi:MAG: MBOAT family protein [Magnetospirillum sp.]|nr:MBOAT family protein [Magnetospirillum sp.]